MHKVAGGCHCGNITYLAEISHDLSVYNPRVCDCEFCTTHGASYMSDRNGTLKFKIKTAKALGKYRQGTGIADFLICKNCGVLVGVCYEERGIVYGSLNTKSLHTNSGFGEFQVISPMQLTDEERIKRWKKFWFSNVEIEYENA